MSLILLIVGVVLFIGLVVVHEFGHFIFARRNGVEVEEFGIFFPPRLFKKKTKAGWLFTINLLPLGGFVRLKGEHDTDTEKGSFGAASLLAKTKIMAAGVGMNLITALILLTALAFLGMPKLVDNQFTVKSDTKVSRSEVLAVDIEPGSPAAKAGIQPDDRLAAIGADAAHLKGVDNANTLPNVTKGLAGQTVHVVYEHKGQPHVAVVKLRTAAEVAASQKTNNPKGYLGIVPQEFTLQRSTWSAPVVAVGLAGQFTALTFQGLGHALGGLGSLIAGAVTGNSAARQNGQATASSQVSGPVGIFVILKDGSLLGYQFMLFIIAIISLTLAIMNILPIPALDGGRLWITLVARAFKKPLSAKTEEIVNATGFVVLIGLVILITIVDVHRFF
ncbi:MAG TPA: M50 family metallopeptidase [Patescibacteria group bacterium]|nr:M50 family metallopeptidase [Patescibacteria group bacterium]